MVRSQKRLMGVESTPELRKLLEVACEEARNTKTSSSESAEDSATENTKSGSAVRTALAPLSIARACRILQEFEEQQASSSTTSSTSDSSSFVTIPVLQAMKAVMDASTTTTTTASKLIFHDHQHTNERSTREQRSYEKRMERLRLQHESYKYSKLTSNLSRHVQDDDVTAKSMTYAASIGLNMIVAPISFGGFMYFFGGSLLDFLWPHTGATKEIRKILLGVTSGVGLLFVELLLFVIRTHALDTAVRRKKRNPAHTPFGHYTAASSKTYRDKE